MGGGRKQKKRQIPEGLRGGERTRLKKRGTEREVRGRNSTTELGDAKRKGREQRGLAHPELLVLTVQGRSCGKVNSRGEFLSAFNHLHASQETIKMSVLDPAVW